MASGLADRVGCPGSTDNRKVVSRRSASHKSGLGLSPLICKFALVSPDCPIRTTYPRFSTLNLVHLFIHNLLDELIQLCDYKKHNDYIYQFFKICLPAQIFTFFKLI